LDLLLCLKNTKRAKMVNMIAIRVLEFKNAVRYNETFH